MKKFFAMLAVILLCGSMMISCHKDDNNTNNTNNPKYPTKADMVGTWEGSFQGTATINDAAENYTINWVLTLNAEGSNTVGSLAYTATFNTLQDLANQVVVNNYYVKENTEIGRIMLTGYQMAGILDESIDFNIDLNAKTLKGTLQVHTNNGEDMVTLGGMTTLKKK